MFGIGFYYTCDVVLGVFAEHTLWYDPSTVTHWENMTWAALSYNSLPHLPEPFPHLLPPTPVMHWGHTSFMHTAAKWH